MYVLNVPMYVHARSVKSKQSQSVFCYISHNDNESTEWITGKCIEKWHATVTRSLGYA